MRGSGLLSISSLRAREREERLRRFLCVAHPRRITHIARTTTAYPAAMTDASATTRPTVQGCLEKLRNADKVSQSRERGGGHPFGQQRARALSPPPPRLSVLFKSRALAPIPVYPGLPLHGFVRPGGLAGPGRAGGRRRRRRGGGRGAADRPRAGRPDADCTCRVRRGTPGRCVRGCGDTGGQMVRRPGGSIKRMGVRGGQRREGVVREDAHAAGALVFLVALSARALSPPLPLHPSCPPPHDLVHPPSRSPSPLRLAPQACASSSAT